MAGLDPAIQGGLRDVSKRPLDGRLKGDHVMGE
jgi:hypothetical protein